MHEIGIEWMTQTEVNGHFLELRGIPDEKPGMGTNSGGDCRC